MVSVPVETALHLSTVYKGGGNISNMFAYELSTLYRSDRSLIFCTGIDVLTSSVLFPITRLYAFGGTQVAMSSFKRSDPLTDSDNSALGICPFPSYLKPSTEKVDPENILSQLPYFW